MRKGAPSGSRDEASYWTGLKGGDFLALSDTRSFQEGGAHGVDWRVRDIRRVAARDRATGRPLATWHIHDLERAGAGQFCLVVVEAAGDFELRLYFVPRSWATGSRDRLVDLGASWLFLPPPDPEDFLSSDLEYAPFPDVPPLDEGGAPTRREFALSGFGSPVYGSYARDGEEVPVIIVEWATAEEGAPDPLLLALEERWMLPDGRVLPAGGTVSPMLGHVLAPGDVEIYPS